MDTQALHQLTMARDSTRLCAPELCRAAQPVDVAPSGATVGGRHTSSLACAAMPLRPGSAPAFARTTYLQLGLCSVGVQVLVVVEREAAQQHHMQPAS